jgi:hypothetical protein
MSVRSLKLQSGDAAPINKRVEASEVKAGTGRPRTIRDPGP